MPVINLKVNNQCCPIYIGSGLLHQIESLISPSEVTQILIVSHPGIANCYLSSVLAVLKNYQCESLLLPEGEQHKTLDQMSLIIDKLVEKAFRRDAILIALGGKIHSPEEYILLDSLVERSQLSFLLLSKLCEYTSRG